MSLVEPVVLSGARIVETVLRRGRAKPEEILVLRGGSSRGLARLVSLAESKGVSLRWVDPAELEPLTGGSSRDVALQMGARETLTLEAAVPPKPVPALVLALEGIEDPHNLGDVLRSALAAGADAVALDSHAREMPRDVVARSSAGASECLPLVFADRLVATLEGLRALGVEPVAATAQEGEDAFRAKWPARTALVIGGERRGLSRATLEACPRRITIPMAREVQSLSASAGAAVLLFEFARRRVAASR